MFRILVWAVRVGEVVLEAEQVVYKVGIHERTKSQLMNDSNDRILSFASNHRKVVASLIQKNPSHTHLLPKADAYFQFLCGERGDLARPRWDLAQANVAEETRTRVAAPDSCNHLKGLLMFPWVSLWVTPGLFVRELEAVAQHHHIVCTENTGRLFYVSRGIIDQAGIEI